MVDLPTSWLALGAFATAVAAGWSTLQQWGSWLIQIPFGRCRLENASTSYFLARKVWRFNPCLNFDTARITPRGVSKVAVLSHRGVQPGKTLEFCLYGWCPIFISSGDLSHIWFIRGTLDPFKLAVDTALELDRASREICANARHEVRIVHGSGSVWSRSSKGKEGSDVAPQDRGRNPMAQPSVDGWYMACSDTINVAREEMFATGQTTASLYSLPAEMVSVYAQIKNWVESESWYLEHHVPWRIGTLLTGKPGVGKSTFVFWLAQRHSLPVHVFDLATMSNGEFISAWRDASRQAPCIVLLEDFDGVFDGRTNLAGELGGGLTFDCLLNALCGASDAHGIALFVTSNHPEKLDDAMRYRPGRIDIEKEVPGLDEAGLVNLVTKLVDDPDSQKSILGLNLVGRPAAEVKAHCIKVALQDKHKKDAHVQSC